MRLCVMAALHQDFNLALQLGAHSDSKQKYSEDISNMLYFMNILKQLNKSTNLANESQVYSNYSQVVNNPYLKLFY